VALVALVAPAEQRAVAEDVVDAAQRDAELGGELPFQRGAFARWRRIAFGCGVFGPSGHLAW
jgi:hypothetical protein